jgi:hypothetical protein
MSVFGFGRKTSMAPPERTLLNDLRAGGERAEAAVSLLIDKLSQTWRTGGHAAIDAFSQWLQVIEEHAPEKTLQFTARALSLMPPDTKKLVMSQHGLENSTDDLAQDPLLYPLAGRIVAGGKDGADALMVIYRAVEKIKGPQEAEQVAYGAWTRALKESQTSMLGHLPKYIKDFLFMEEQKREIAAWQEEIQKDMHARKNAIMSAYNTHLNFSGEKAAVQAASELIAKTPPDRLKQLVAFLPAKLRRLVIINPDLEIRRLNEVLDIRDQKIKQGGKDAADALREVFDTLESQSGTYFAQECMEHYYNDELKSLSPELSKTIFDNLPDDLTQALIGSALMDAFTKAMTQEAKEAEGTAKITEGLLAGGMAAERVFDFFEENVRTKLEKGDTESIDVFMHFYELVKEMDNDDTIARFVKRFFPMLPQETRREVARLITD